MKRTRSASLKLTLKSETVRVLSGRSLQQVRGGTLVEPTYNACSADSKCPGCEPDTDDGAGSVAPATYGRTCSCGC
jgi:hypothetical protein